MPKTPDAKDDLEKLVGLILTSLDDDKAQDVLAIDLVGKTSIADRMIIASGTSGRMVSAMAVHLGQKLRQAGYKPKSEGEKFGDWVVVDAGDVIVHLFRPEVRTFYNIERIWQAAPVKTATVASPPKPKAKARQEGKPKLKAKPKAKAKPAARKPAKRA